MDFSEKTPFPKKRPLSGTRSRVIANSYLAVLLHSFWLLGMEILQIERIKLTTGNFEIRVPVPGAPEKFDGRKSHQYSGGRGCWEKEVWDFQAKSTRLSRSSGSCSLFLHFLAKIAFQKMFGKCWKSQTLFFQTSAAF